MPELRREPLQGSSHPAVAGQSVSSMPSTASSDLDEEKAASREYSDSAIEKKKKLIDAAKTAREALRARLLAMPLPAPNDLEGGVSQPDSKPRSDGQSSSGGWIGSGGWKWSSGWRVSGGSDEWGSGEWRSVTSGAWNSSDSWRNARRQQKSK